MNFTFLPIKKLKLNFTLLPIQETQTYCNHERQREGAAARPGKQGIRPTAQPGSARRNGRLARGAHGAAAAGQVRFRRGWGYFGVRLASPVRRHAGSRALALVDGNPVQRVFL